MWKNWDFFLSFSFFFFFARESKRVVNGTGVGKSVDSSRELKINWAFKAGRRRCCLCFFLSFASGFSCFCCDGTNRASSYVRPEPVEAAQTKIRSFSHVGSIWRRIEYVDRGLVRERDGFVVVRDFSNVWINLMIWCVGSVGFKFHFLHFKCPSWSRAQDGPWPSSNIHLDPILSKNISWFIPNAIKSLRI